MPGLGNSMADDYADIIAEASTWEGVRYMHGQHSRYGCDCIGLLIGVGKATQRIPREYQPVPYRGDWHLHNYHDLINEGILAIGGYLLPEESVPCGAIVLFHYRHAHVASHAGILLPESTLLHARSQRKRVVRHRFHLQYNPVVVGYYGWPERFVA